MFTKFTNNLRMAKSNDLPLLILLDFSTVFDTVDHHLQLGMHHSFGLKDTGLFWFPSYLSDRSLGVSFASSTSSPLSLASEVPQDTVLGPLLCSLYTAISGVFKGVFS